MDTAQDIANETIIKFISMNGAGNKFLIHDSRYKRIDMNKDLILYFFDKLLELLLISTIE